MAETLATQFPDPWGRLGNIPLPTAETIIGKGASAEVYRWNRNGTQMAVKRIRVTDGCASDIERELKIVAQLKHRHIIQCCGVDRDANYVYIIMDSAEGGSLKDAVTRLDWDNKRRIVVEIALGLGYLHSQGIVHRDIKGANILLTEHDEVKLCDFGIAKVMASATCASTFIHGTRGTQKWIAPELRCAKPKYSARSDIFALGVVMQDLVDGDTPLDYTALMTRCLDKDPEKRPSIQDIVDAFQVVPISQDKAGGDSQVEANQVFLTEEEFKQGMGFLRGDGVEINRAEAAERFRRAATMGDPKAQFFLGTMYHGNGILRDHTKAAEWLQKAADQGYMPALALLGRSYLEGGDCVPQDHHKALDLLSQATNEGEYCRTCRCGLGRIYLEGLGVAQSNEEAFRWYHESAFLGCPLGQLQTGVFYFNGITVEQNYTEAAWFFAAAAVQGISDAQLYMAKMYEFGKGVSQNSRAAWDWYLKAADGGSMEAQNIVGLVYCRGEDGVPKNKTRGLMWLKKAADQGHEESQYLLEEMHHSALTSKIHDSTSNTSITHKTISKMENIELVEKIGHGGQAEVFKVKVGLDDMVLKKFLDPTHEDSKREVAIIKQLHNRYIVQFHQVHQDMLMMEYLEGGSLLDAILGGSIADWETKTRIAKQASLGLAYLHSLDIIHCDIKSANIVLTKHMDAKICDFGRARTVGQTGGGGTLPWMAPELFLDPPEYSLKSDVYALGMVMWEMASGCTQPYKDHTQDLMIDCIQNGFTEEVPVETPEAYAACIQECWHHKPEDRPAALNILPDVKSTSRDRDVDDLGISEEEQDENSPFFSKAIKKGYPIHRLLGGIYLNGTGVKKDYAKAMELFLKASDSGDSDAMFSIGEMYNSGHGVEQDYCKAMEWFVKASEGGVIKALVTIGKMFLNGHGVEQDYSKAMEWFCKGNDGGDSSAKFYIGVMYHNSFGVEQDYGKAMEWFLKASDAGDSDAMFNIGDMYKRGYGVEEDFSKAMEWYLKASKSRDSEAMFNIGVMYLDGLGVEQDYHKAMEWFIKASDNGSLIAMFYIGTMYQNGEGVEQDYTKSMNWFLNASNGGLPRAMYNIGNMFLEGRGVEQDSGKALEWLLKANDSGYLNAKFNIASMYHNGVGIEQDYSKAMEWFLKASDSGDSEAMVHIGNIYYYGHGMEQDYGKAMEWYLKASDGGHSVGQCGVGTMYHEGHGVPQDYGKAMEWYLKASDGGSPSAHFSIGTMYHDGQGTEQDYTEAMEWFIKASDSGVSEAMIYIGDMYDYGRGVEQDHGKAMEWYLTASEDGNPVAKFGIGTMYREGRGVQQDYGKAMEWYLRAGVDGNSDAQFNIGDMYLDSLGIKQDYGKAMEWFAKASGNGSADVL
ncbi:hypothetical protein BGZ99_005385 [Dissophora globulifera]|uniref:Protein kinase domain-containing protein n=1 Tax=Dissophora globulifera TaxID=979702 RepID=A0A9P6UTE2_9FUNG|nr:hypothetical protein BGZ99_005385 [Dissophora globulifera]